MVRGELSLLSARLRQEVLRLVQAGRSPNRRPAPIASVLPCRAARSKFPRLRSPLERRKRRQYAADPDHGSFRSSSFRTATGAGFACRYAPVFHLLPAGWHGEFFAHVAFARVAADSTGGAHALDARPGGEVPRVSAADDLIPALGEQPIGKERHAPHEKVKMRGSALLRFELPEG